LAVAIHGRGGRGGESGVVLIEGRHLMFPLTTFVMKDFEAWLAVDRRVAFHTSELPWRMLTDWADRSLWKEANPSAGGSESWSGRREWWPVMSSLAPLMDIFVASITVTLIALCTSSFKKHSHMLQLMCWDEMPPTRAGRGNQSPWGGVPWVPWGGFHELVHQHGKTTITANVRLLQDLSPEIWWSTMKFAANLFDLFVIKDPKTLPGRCLVAFTTLQIFHIVILEICPGEGGGGGSEGRQEQGREGVDLWSDD
jgi:hypothetical protein